MTLIKKLKKIKLLKATKSQFFLGNLQCISFIHKSIKKYNQKTLVEFINFKKNEINFLLKKLTKIKPLFLTYFKIII